MMARGGLWITMMSMMTKKDDKNGIAGATPFLSSSELKNSYFILSITEYICSLEFVITR